MAPFGKKLRQARQPRCTALVAAAGSSSRMGGINKLMEPLDGIPVLIRTLTALERARRVDAIIVAAREEDLVPISQLCHTYGITKCTKVIRGGESRTHSVLLAALEADGETELLAVQDGARPLVSQSVLEQGIAVTDDCAAVERLGKTVYLVEGEESNLKITTPGDLILAEALLHAEEDL